MKDQPHPRGQFAPSLALLALLIVVSLARADDPLPTPPPSAAPPAPAEKPDPTIKPAPAVPTLDDLLGTAPTPKPAAGRAPSPGPADEDADALDAATGTTDPTNLDLDRRLSAQELGDAFEQAITLMGDAAQRMEHQRDVGLGTQRIQGDVLRKLDELIAQIEKNKQQQKQKQSQSQSKGQQSEPRSQPGAKKKPQQQQQAATPGGDNPGTSDGPPRQEGALRPGLESAQAAWGNLPERIRDMLLQGSGDRFSTTWERATEVYYRRLAEEERGE